VHHFTPLRDGRFLTCEDGTLCILDPLYGDVTSLSKAQGHQGSITSATELSDNIVATCSSKVL
jgi:hypothetical protein